MDVQPSDGDLIRACRSGDARAWELMLDRYERLVFSIPLSYGLPREDAADIAQATFTLLLRSIETLREDSRLGPWLATVARRQTWRSLRRRRAEHHDQLDFIDERLPSIGAPHSDPLERWELVEWLHMGMAALGGRCRALLQALYLDPGEPSYAEVAARVGIAVGSIGPTRARCLERLKQILQERR